MVTSLVGVINDFSDLTEQKAIRIGFYTGLGPGTALSWMNVRRLEQD
jgi:hypothetical protein